ncbi:MAG: hypothetical protein AAFQ82_24425, partial [Myxococcota bacterium]
MRGYEFFLWSPRPNWEINAVSYDPGTRVEIYEISTTATENSGVTTVSLPGELLLRQSLEEGEDLLVAKSRAGTNITRAGHTYRVVSNNPVTVMFGAFEQRERDGGGYVPSENGTTVGTHFYFPVPSGPYWKYFREIRIVAGDLASDVTLRGFGSDGWEVIDNVLVDPYGHLDYTGRSHVELTQYDFFEVLATEPVNVFEANWLETGNSGTSDVISYVSALDSAGASDVGQEFVAYIGPPGIQNSAAGLGGRFSHLYIATFVAGTQVTVVDADTGGTIFQENITLGDVDSIYDVRIDTTQYNAMNSGGNRPYLRVSADEPISVGTANWNDNWLAFASGILPVSLSMDISQLPEIVCDSTESFTIDVTNDGDASIDNIALSAEALGGFTILTQPTAIGTLAPGATNSQQVTGFVSCTETATGELAGISAVASGDSGGSSVGVNETSVAQTVVPGTVGII